MNVLPLIEKTVLSGVEKIFGKQLSSVEFVPTRKDFEGDITVVVFSLLKEIKGNPEVIGNQIGTYLQEQLKEVKSFNVVKGFLNISFTDRFFSALSPMLYWIPLMVRSKRKTPTQ